VQTAGRSLSEGVFNGVMSESRAMSLTEALKYALTQTA
jgi:hypothetical protein